MATLETKVRRSPDLLCETVHGETVILDLRGESYWGLDAVGTRIWEMLGEGLGLGPIRERILAEYAVDPAVLERDLIRLVEQLAAAGLVELADA